MSRASRKFDPGRAGEAALDEHLRVVAHRNGRIAALFLACFTAVLWPTDWVIFRGMPQVTSAIAWLRCAVVSILLVEWLLLRSRLGPRHPVAILGGGGVVIMCALGYVLGGLGGAERPWIHLADPALFFSVLAPLRWRARSLLVGGLTLGLCLGFVLAQSGAWWTPMVRVSLSFVSSLAVGVIAVGHMSFRILRQSFWQSLEIERSSRALAELNETLESRVRAQTHDLRRLTDHLERAREDERTHIARELHDELGQELTALHLAVALTRQRFQRDPQCIAGNLGEVEALLQRTRATTRNLVTELRPRLLDELGLPAALEWLARQTEQRSGVSCRLTVDGATALPADTCTVAFRIVQEALTNVVRHAQAHVAEITLAARDGALSIAVSDDGVGLSPAQRELPSSPGVGSGFGLIGIRERVTLLQGRLELRERAGGGTTLLVTLPLARAATVPEVEGGRA